MDTIDEVEHLADFDNIIFKRCNPGHAAGMRDRHVFAVDVIVSVKPEHSFFVRRHCSVQAVRP